MREVEVLQRAGRNSDSRTGQERTALELTAVLVKQRFACFP